MGGWLYLAVVGVPLLCTRQGADAWWGCSQLPWYLLVLHETARRLHETAGGYKNTPGHGARYINISSLHRGTGVGPTTQELRMPPIAAHPTPATLVFARRHLPSNPPPFHMASLGCKAHA